MLEEEAPSRSATNRIRNILYRRKTLVFSVALAVFSLAAYLALSLPNIYRSSALLLGSPQRLPPSYVTSTLTQTGQERIYGITQQILSRTNLEKIVKQFSLYSTARWVTMEDRVEELRKKIRINAQTDQSSSRRENPQSSVAFALSFDAEAPEKATSVTARLAALFIDENIRLREQEATGTTSFINTEAERIRKDLEQQETEVNRYKAQHRFELQEQLDANIKTLEQLRLELQNNTLLLASLQDRRGALEKQLVEVESALRREAMGNDRLEPGQPQSLDGKKALLRTLINQFTEKHPDVIRLKKEIQALEAEASPEELAAPAIPSNPVSDTLRRQIGEVQIEIPALATKIQGLRADIASYQQRVDNTPLREIEFSKISRNYQITLKKYQDMLAKTLESQLSENMEKQQKGEQFQILDPASVPQKPLFPNRPLILILGLGGGLTAGLLLALYLENSDSSIKKGDTIQNVPLLAMLPQIASRSTVLEQRRAQGFLVLASMSSIVIGILIIHFSVPFFFY